MVAAPAGFTRVDSLQSLHPEAPRCNLKSRDHTVHSNLILFLQVDDELQALMALLPGLELRFDRMKADLLLRLLTHKDRIASNMIALRRELPDANVAHIVSRYPALVTDFSEEELVHRIIAIRCAPAPPDFTAVSHTSPLRHLAAARHRELQCEPLSE